MQSALVVAVAVLVSTAGAMAQSTVVDFANDAPGKPPAGFSFALTGQGKPGVWLVRSDDVAHGNVLVQTDADSTGYRFPVAVYDAVTAQA